jgi:hypothetical protein
MADHDPLQRAVEILNTILESLLEEQVLVDDPDWDTVAVLAEVAPAVVSLTAYRYTGDGSAQPTPLRGTKLQLFKDHQAATAAPDGTRWQVCIVKVDRDSARVAVSYVYGDEAEQWTITPATFQHIAEQLRPRPEDFVNPET